MYNKYIRTNFNISAYSILQLTCDPSIMNGCLTYGRKICVDIVSVRSISTVATIWRTTNHLNQISPRQRRRKASGTRRTVELLATADRSNGWNCKNTKNNLFYRNF